MLHNRANDRTIVLGAVAYDPKVVTIWEGMIEHFQNEGTPLDVVLFSNYERQVDALFRGHIDIAWNTPLAHVRVRRRSEGRSLSLGMRDSDRDFHAKVLVRKDAGIRSIADLAGKTVAVGSRDSTQARILPLFYLERAGVDVSSLRLLPFDTDLGKHGDTGTSELDVLAALHDGRAQAGCIGDLVWVMQQAAGRVDPTKVELLWTTPGFDHCMFDALPALSDDKSKAFRACLSAMKWDVPQHRRLLELEGLKQWVPAREEGYESLREALDRSGDW